MIYLGTIVTENSSSLLRATLVDEDDVPVSGVLITAMRMTLFEVQSNKVINGREDQNILNVNGGTIDGSGLFELVLGADDNVIIRTERQETHAIELEWEWTDGGNNKRKTETIHFVVENQRGVP